MFTNNRKDLDKGEKKWQFVSDVLDIILDLLTFGF
jgi:hypothetical protein